ncbi:MAG: PASTA domain-containing protein [Spirochaetaceae bacterium]|jgi:beta-lactam-binding protein with PASTA domain|nr:PASTA domain-containing protein [Spirochaetaceae bacterium]
MDIKQTTDGIDEDKTEDKTARKIGVVLIAAIALLAVMALAAFAVFFISVRGPEQTMVPNLVGKDIIEALLEMQQKELYPRIQLRFSQSALDKNTILEQEPHAGAIVKAGRRIRLVVSQGAQISRIENYIGRMLSDVRAEFQTLVTGGGAGVLLTVKEPVMYEESSAPAGTILEQTPQPGTGISGPAALSFVVSKGKVEDAQMPTLIGLDIKAALAEIVKTGIQAEFQIRAATSRQTPETVVSQTPSGGVLIPKDKSAVVVVAAPQKNKLDEDEVFLLFTYDLPPSPFPVVTTLAALDAEGKREQLAELGHRGGRFSFPCRLKRGTILTLSMLGTEVYRQTVE